MYVYRTSQPNSTHYTNSKLHHRCEIKKEQQKTVIVFFVKIEQVIRTWYILTIYAVSNYVIDILI